MTCVVCVYRIGMDTLQQNWASAYLQLSRLSKYVASLALKYLATV